MVGHYLTIIERRQKRKTPSLTNRISMKQE
nr:MAG TPA: hypothetical protein [Caudoviricetes sp.]